MTETIQQLAAEKFPDLTDAERKLTEAMDRGVPAVFGDPAKDNTDPENHPGHADQWGQERTLRAEVLRWLCIDVGVSAAVDVRGIQIHAAKIRGVLDLSFALVRFPLRLYQCAIPDGINLIDTETRRLSLSGSHTGPITGDGVVVRGDIFLQGDFRATGAVLLRGAKIGGNLTCNGGRFLNRGGHALSADRAEVDGGVFLDQGFRALGEVRLLGAKIGSNLECRGGRFLNRGGHALSADGAEVGGDVFFVQGFRALGKVRLLGAKIGGDLTCNGGRFLNRGGDALSADRAEVGGSVFLDRSFHTTGWITLAGSRIKGQLSCEQARFGGRGHPGLSMENATVEGTFLWKEVHRSPETELKLAHATLGPMVDDKDSWPESGKLHLDGLTYNTFAQASPCNARERLEWLQRQPALPFRPQPYQQLAEVLRRSGHEADAKKVLIARERARRKHGGLTRKGRVWSVILDVMIGHGYKPYKIIPWGAVFVLLGWALFYYGHEAGRMVPIDGGAYASTEYRQTRKPPAGYPAFNAFVYSLDTFLPIVDLHQETYWEPSSGSYCTGWGQSDCYDPLLRFYLWFQILAGWFVTTLGVAGFTGLVRKD